MHKVEFDEPVEGLKKLQQPLSFLSASVKIEILDPVNKQFYQSCSGAYISDSGEMLTASHCLDHCRFKEDGTRRFPGAEADRCEIRINGVVQSAEVLIAGDCEFERKNEYHNRLASELSVTHVSENCRKDLSDYAVLRVPRKEALGKFACLGLSEKRPGLDEGVFTMGYPSQTFRSVAYHGAKDAPGGVLRVSSGNILKSAQCEHKWKARTNIEHLIYGKEGAENLALPEKSYALGRDSLQTTVDAVPGSSGGPLINAAGEIVGVASSASREVHDNNTECRGATFFQPVVDLKAKLGPRLGSCDKNKAGAGTAL